MMPNYYSGLIWKEEYRLSFLCFSLLKYNTFSKIYSVTFMTVACIFEQIFTLCTICALCEWPNKISNLK